MRLSQIKLANIGGFEAVEVLFDPQLTVLVGSNGSGKTTLLHAIAQTLRATLWSTDGETISYRLRAGQSSGSIEINGTHADGETSARIDVLTRPDGRIVAESRGGLLASATPPLPIACFFPERRLPGDQTPQGGRLGDWGPYQTYASAFEGTIDFEPVFLWFREREDIENEVRRDEPAHVDPQLDAVRGAVERLLSLGGRGPRFSELHVRRPRGSLDEQLPRRRPILEIDKDGVALAFDQLSEGERTMVALAADIARRLAIANPTTSTPLLGAGVVLIDEIELHLHPRWQAEILPRLLDVFPNVQFIVTTHSPVVLTRVKAEQIRLLEDFKVYSPQHPVEGRDAGSILSDVFGIDPLPPETRAAVSRISELVDEDRIPEARGELNALSEKLGDLDVEVTRLRTILDLLAS